MKRSVKSKLKNKKGQVTIEAVLMMVVIVMVVSMVGNFFKSNEVIKALVYSPWQSMSGMLQNGSWGPPDQTDDAHPNQSTQKRSLKGE